MIASRDGTRVVEHGVVARERSDPRQGEILRRWFEDRVLPAFAGRVLPFDLPAARILATYRVPEHAPLDALIAAIAQAADMTIATRNIRHFEPLGVACLNLVSYGGLKPKVDDDIRREAVML